MWCLLDILIYYFSPYSQHSMLDKSSPAQTLPAPAPSALNQHNPLEAKPLAALRSHFAQWYRSPHLGFARWPWRSALLRSRCTCRRWPPSSVPSAPGRKGRAASGSTSSASSDCQTPGGFPANTKKLSLFHSEFLRIACLPLGRPLLPRPHLLRLRAARRPRKTIRPAGALLRPRGDAFSGRAAFPPGLAAAP